jgi:hypothetical protein
LLPWERAARIAAQIADALAEAHRHGIVHRDLKPGNIMLVEVGRRVDFVKVLDFGVAKVEGLKMTRTGSVIGTPQYMSPEQLRGEQLDGRSDLYSLGIILYEMVAGQLPFKANSVAGYMHKHLNEVPAPPSNLTQEAELPVALEEIVLQCLAKPCIERFQDAEDLGQRLESLAAGAPSMAVVAQPVPAGARRRPRVWLWVALSAALLTLSAAGLGGWIILGRGGMLEGEPAANQRGAAWRPVDRDEEGGEEWIDDEAAPEAEQAVSASASVRAGPGEVTGDAGAPASASEPRRPRVAARSERERARPSMRVRRKTRPRGAGADIRGSRGESSEEAREEDEDKQRGVNLAMSETRHKERDLGASSAKEQEASGKTAAGALEQLSISQLEARLKKLMRNSKAPPSTLKKVLQIYRKNKQRWPKSSREALQRSYLTNLIKSYSQASMQFHPRERKSLARLKQIFMTMKMKTDLAPGHRRKIIDQQMQAYDRSSIDPRDRTYYRRMALLNLIKSMAVNPAEALR